MKKGWKNDCYYKAKDACDQRGEMMGCLVFAGKKSTITVNVCPSVQSRVCHDPPTAISAMEDGRR